MSILAAALPVLKKVGASVGTHMLANRRTAKQTRENKKLAQYSFDKNVEMWNMQNEYNSPKNQMKRFSDAGLNPNLMYGKGTPGNATTLPQYQGLESSGTMYGHSMSGLQGIANVEKVKTEVMANQISNDWAPAMNQMQLSLQEAQKGAIQANIMLTRAQAASEGQNFNYKKAQTSYVNAQTDNVDISNKRLQEQFKQEAIRTEQVRFGIENAGAVIKGTFQTMKEANWSDEHIRWALAGMQATDRLISIFLQIFPIAKAASIFGPSRTNKVVNNPDAAAAIKRINVQNQ